MLQRILIVDDSPLSRKLVQRGLEFAGLKGREMLHAGDGVEALEVLARGRVDLMITDLTMPRMDGVALLRELVANPERPPVIVSTSLATSSWGEELRRLGVVAVVPKPLTPDSFIASVSEIEGARS